MASKDYYKTLGVEKNASQDEIKRAFRKLAHQYHPDKPDGNEQKFKEVNEAYQALGDEKKRQQYDQFGSTFDQAGAGGFGGFSGQNPFGGGFSSANFDMGDLGDIFGDVFGFGSRSRRQARGADIEMDLTVDFMEAVFGAEKVISLNKNIVCPNCSGNGAEPGSKIYECPACKGSGRQSRVQQTILGAIQTQVACPDCGGKGRKIEKKCSRCKGMGIVNENEEIKVSVPAGIDNGESLKLSGRGEAASSGEAGDLYLHIRVRPSDQFERRGYDILSNQQISFARAALGDKMEINTIDGEVSLKIPAGTQPGTKFRLKGKGIPKLRGYGRGDHWVIIDVNVPKNLTREQKDLLNKLDL
ncbi:MAG TPA: molecular chaperone DnaJ [Candidatus Bipolaricaulota bacterium]|nr:molecular chaperone DnaJ [Candidatus Bipolaricaulota bacterium]